MYKNQEKKLVITSVDREANTIHLLVHGRPVTAACQPEDNLEIHENVKRVLIGILLHPAA